MIQSLTTTIMMDMSKEDLIKRLVKESKPSNWINDAKWRQDNDYWTQHSFRISLTILRHLRENRIDKELFLNFMREQGGVIHINELLRGKYNYTLREIGLAEELLGIHLINIK
jgi:hypothetical protein